MDRQSQEPSSSGIVKNISILLGGSMLAQLIGIVVLPFLTRLYSADAFGVLGVFMALAGILATLVTGRYNISVMLAESEQESRASLLLSFGICILFSISVFALVFINLESLTFLNTTGVSGYLFLLPLILLCLGFQQTLEIALSRKKQFMILSLSALAGAILGNGLKLYWPYYSQSSEAYGLVYGSIAAAIVAVLVMFISVQRFPLTIPSWNQLKTLASKYSDLPKYRAPKDFLNAVTQNFPAIFIASFFSVSVAGLFVLAEKIVRLPAVLAGGAVRKVLLQKMSELQRQGLPVFPLIRRCTLMMAMIGLLPLLVLFLWGESCSR